MEVKDDNIKIVMDENVGQGTYSNLAMVAHSQSEFVLDFLRVVPGVKTARVHSRIIMTPEHAKRLLRALGENIKNYEHVNGEIRLPEDAFKGGNPVGEA
ncbi:MAG TPA: DUF3467 domain-containing protein [Candidatus Avibacteroides excrementipullorum]|nr:DUF3467 domain-containing protein [Candidatus Avibacteroides excrementipullorum]